ncbi:hypothetical protein [Actinoplanes teichomyceticus]|uniref:Uncharacterized protein n=1 Tax=Actinoplanes teichomyceticus TaxID=1867 RepID=A0A561VIK8_ACTTI|nr:hypothetical protein [Actinoplanes teichomyceticus]TWG11445.1 hypothetical protein FHX34_106175 [Actinoplanes teichomyceticus]GIF15741.1 hypothetical protein Ate01nite_57730 [Actinoplanes teichomyceticus]
MSTDRSLPPHVQKAFWARALVFQVLDLHHVQLEAAGYGLFWNAVRERLLTSTAAQIEFCPAGSLSSYLSHLGTEIRAGIPFPDRDAERTCAPLLDEIDRVLRDAGQLREDLLMSAFAATMQAAVELYHRHGEGVPDDVVKRVSVTFGHQGMPVQSELPIQLTATTYLEDQPEGPSARVDVVINPGLLDELTVFSLPYVLLHECVCHVLQGPWQSGRSQPDPGDRFAEGWMDVAAYLAHQTLDYPWLGDASGLDLLAPRRAAARLEAAEKVHRARHQRTPHGRSWAQRAMGAQAAQSTVALLAKLPETRTDPAAAFTRLSTRLNSSTFSNRQRELFVARVHKATMGRVDAGLVTQIRQYLSTDDLHQLVHGILAIHLTNE